MSHANKSHSSTFTFRIEQFCREGIFTDESLSFLFKFSEKAASTWKEFLKCALVKNMYVPSTSCDTADVASSNIAMDGEW